MPDVRPLTGDERALLDALLAFDFEGVEELREQARYATASRGCTCGCGSIDLYVPDGVPPSPVPDGALPPGGSVLDATGRAIGGIVLLVADGRLSYLELYPLGDGPLPVPPLDRVRLED